MAVNDYAQLRNAVIGYGFDVNLIEPQSLLVGNSINASTHPSGEWRFIVLVDNKPVGLIAVVKMQGHWRMAMAGASEMAKENMGVVSFYADRKPAVQLRFIRSQQGIMDLN